MPGGVSLRGQDIPQQPRPATGGSVPSKSHPAESPKYKHEALPVTEPGLWAGRLSFEIVAGPNPRHGACAVRPENGGKEDFPSAARPTDEARHPDLQASCCVPTPVIAPGAPRSPCPGSPQSHWLPSNLFSKPQPERSFQDANLIMSLPT